MDGPVRSVHYSVMQVEGSMKYSEPELVVCGIKLARHLELPVPPREKLIEKINEILIERDNYECAKAGLITKDETAYLMLQHFQSLICNLAKVSEPDVVNSWMDLVPNTVNALFKI